MQSSGSKKNHNIFFWEVQGLKRLENKVKLCYHLGPSWLAQGQEKTENQQASSGLSIQMVRSWVMIHAVLVNHPLQGYYNLVVDETQLSQL